jgi:GT2 family glycosyltransferase
VSGGDPLGRPDEERDALAEEALDRFLPPEESGIARAHHVTALIVAHEGAPWLPRTLHALREQVRPPDLVLAVDAGSSDDSEVLLRESLPEVVRSDPAEGMAGGLAAAVDRARAERIEAPMARGRAAEPAWPGVEPDAAALDPAELRSARWYWILHDDSAPDPDSLEQLLLGADRNPRAHVLIPKTVAWSDHGRLVGVGNGWAPGLPVIEQLEPRERDQGQHDVDHPVYTGSSAGMLVRSDTWHALGGMDARAGQWAAAADLCRRVWGCGGDVTFIPHAVVAHRQAGHRGIRRGAADRPSPRRAERAGQLFLELTQAPGPALAWRWVRGWLSTLLRALALLITREPEEASAELRGALDVLAHPGRVRAGRRALRRPPVSDTSRPAHVRAPRGAALNHSLEQWLAGVGPGSGVDRGRLGLPRRVWQPLLVAAALAAAALVRDPGQLIGAGTLRGGGLLPATGAVDLLGDYLTSWQDVRFGVPTAQPAYLPILAAASVPLLGSVDLLLRLLFGMAVPLAFLSAYASIGTQPVGRSRPMLVGHQRIALALAWAMLPAGVAAMSGGRISTLALLLLGPPTARLLAAALLQARRVGTGIHPAISAGTMLGIVSAFAPLTYVLVVAAALVGWLALGMPRWAVRTGLVTLAVAGGFLVLWLPQALTAPWLLLSDLGRNDVSLGDPAPWPVGLSPGGPSSTAWAGLPLLAAAVVAVVARTRTARMLAALTAALLLVAAVGWIPLLVSAVWPAVDPAGLWHGQLLLIAGGLLVVLLARAATARVRGARPGRARVVSVMWLGCVAVLAAGWWVAPSTMTVASDVGMPPVAALDAESPGRPRALVLDRAEDGAVRYGVATGPTARLGDADAVAGAAADPAFTDVVASLVSGSGGDLQSDLGGRGIRYVVFNGPAEDGLVADLDAASELRRLSGSPEQSLWLVTGQPARATLAGRDGTDEVVVPVATSPTTIDVVLHPQIVLPRTLRLAESADPGWRAELAGEVVPLSADDRGMLVGEIAAAGPLQVEHRSTWPYLAIGHLAMMGGLVVLALPKRRSIDLDGEAST